MPDVDNLRKGSMKEAYFFAYNIHPGSTKIYHDLKDTYWWNGIKRDIAKFVSKCLTCQQVKLEHQRPSGIIATITHSRVEMGHDCHGFCEWFISYVKGL